MIAIVDTATNDVLFMVDSAEAAYSFDLTGRHIRDVVDGDFLPTLRSEKWNKLKAARDEAEWGGVDTPWGRFDSDEQSQGKINGAVTAALVLTAQQQAFLQNWTLADNSVVQLDGTAMVTVGLMIMAWVDAVHQRSRVLRARVATATTAAEVAAITWSMTDA